MILRLVLRSVICLSLVGILLLLSTATSLGTVSAFQPTGEKLALDPPAEAVGPSRMVVDSAIRRGFLMFQLDPGIGIRIIDLDTLSTVAYKQFTFAGDIYMATVDPVAHHLLIPYTSNTAQFVPRFGGIRVVDVDLNEVHDFPRPASGMGFEPLLAGMHLYAPNEKDPRKILLLFQDRVIIGSIYLALLNNVLWASQWDAATGQMDWTYRISSCRGVYPRSQNPGTVQQFFRSQSQNAIFLGCATPDNSGLAVKINLDANGAPLGEDAFPGPAAFDFVLADQVAERIIFVVERDSDESLFFFETARNAYLGAVGISKRASGGVAYAVSPETGRIYTITQDLGILLIDTRRTPPPQGLSFPQFASDGGGDLVVDHAGPDGSRLFVRPGVERDYTIYADGIPISVDPDISELDRFTAGVVEKHGVTTANFEAATHAYGARVLIVGGTDGVFPGATREYARRIGSPCLQFDRELASGLIVGLSLSTGQAVGGAVAAEADPGTKTDLAEPVSRCWPHPDPFGTGLGLLGDQWPRPGRTFDESGTLDGTLGREWPFQKVECSGGEDDTTQSDSLPGFEAEVHCDEGNQIAEGFAQARGGETAGDAFGTEGSPLVTVAESASGSTLKRKEEGGVVVVTEAWSRGIAIAGVGTIDLVETKAISEAAGRAGTAEGHFESRICGARIGSFTQDGCAQRDRVIEEINRVLGARGRASLPQPDPRLLQGSPGGYLASVQKDRFEELSSRALNNDFSTQVPGLQIVLFNDHPTLGRARQVFQFAGVDASTTYGVFLLTQALPPLAPPPNLPLEPTVDLNAAPVDVKPVGSGPPDQKTLIETVIEKVEAGLVLAVRSPTEAALTTVVLITLAAPLYMSLRRRRLVGALERR